MAELVAPVLVILATAGSVAIAFSDTALSKIIPGKLRIAPKGDVDTARKPSPQQQLPQQANVPKPPQPPQPPQQQQQQQQQQQDRERERQQQQQQQQDRDRERARQQQQQQQQERERQQLQERERAKQQQQQKEKEREKVGEDDGDDDAEGVKEQKTYGEPNQKPFVPIDNTGNKASFMEGLDPANWGTSSRNVASSSSRNPF